MRNGCTAAACAVLRDHQGQTVERSWPYIGQRNRQTVRNDAGGQRVRVCLKAEIADTEPLPGLFASDLQ